MAVYLVPAVVGDLVSRSMAAIIGMYQKERPDMDAEVERLERLATMLRAAAEAAEGVHIRNWWLRRWLWTIRDAAVEGAAVARSFRQRAAEDACRRRRGEERRRWWEPLLRSGKGLFFLHDGSWDTVRREVARLEEIAGGMGDFLRLLDRETQLLVQQAGALIMECWSSRIPILQLPTEDEDEEEDDVKHHDDSHGSALERRLAAVLMIVTVNIAVDEANRSGSLHHRLWRFHLHGDRPRLTLAKLLGVAKTQAIVQLRKTEQAHLGDFATLVRFAVTANALA
ncbi:unnamed protein product [Urochloa humidicola]